MTEEVSRMLLISVKESFLVKALEKKLQTAGIEFIYCTPDVTQISNNWKKIDLVTYYMETDERLKPEVLHFLGEQLFESDKGIYLIGDATEIGGLESAVSKSRIRTFTRPLETDLFIDTVSDYIAELGQMSKRKRIMIVDDDPTYLGLIRDWLKSKYVVHMANSGLHAIQMLAKNPVDLILLDFNMPVTDGPQVLEMLRSDPETSRIPVIFLTGRNDKESVMKVVSLKPEGYLLKTIDRPTLQKEIENYFAKEKAGL